MRKFLIVFLLVGVAYAGGSIYEGYHLFNEVMASGENVLAVFKGKHMQIVRTDVGLITTKESVYMDLSKGNAYYISGVGQRSRIIDLTIRVYLEGLSGKETLVALDTMPGRVPSVRLIPTESCTYRVMVTAATMVAGYDEGYYFLAVGVLKL